MRRRIGNLLIIFGILLIFGALGLTIYNNREGVRAAEASQSILNQLIPKIGQGAEEKAVSLSDSEMPAEEIDGYCYIGTIEIPSKGIFLPVMEEWDYSRLKLSPCRYTGSYLTDDLVICAHNYPRHFGSLKWLDLGAEICFTSVDGETFWYAVSNIETLQPTAVEQMILNSSNSEEIQNDWNLTLFTCDIGGQTRFAVRCVRMEV